MEGIYAQVYVHIRDWLRIYDLNTYLGWLVIFLLNWIISIYSLSQSVVRLIRSISHSAMPNVSQRRANTHHRPPPAAVSGLTAIRTNRWLSELKRLFQHNSPSHNTIADCIDIEMKFMAFTSGRLEVFVLLSDYSSFANANAYVLHSHTHLILNETLIDRLIGFVSHLNWG